MKPGWSAVSFTDVARLARRSVDVVETGSYPEVGVRCFGNGLFHKAPRNGLEVGDKKLFRLKRGDFILQVTFAWEGAVGVVNAEDESYFGSVRVLTFEIDPTKTTPEFLMLYFRTPEGVEQLVKISPGSAGRNRVLAVQRLGELMVPLPSVAVQKEIVAHLHEIETRLNHARKVREVQTQQLQAALHSSFHKLESQATWRPLSEVAPLVWRQITINPDQNYTEFGVRSFYRGIFQRRKVSGAIFSWQDIFRLKQGDIVFSNIMSWEKAIAVAHPENDGWVGNHRMLVCEPNPDVILPSCVLHYFMTAQGFAKILKASPGTAVRNKTLKADNLMAIPVPVPPMPAQLEFQKLLDLQSRVTEHTRVSERQASALMPSLLDRIFTG